MPTYTYNGETGDLILDAASGFDEFDPNGYDQNLPSFQSITVDISGIANFLNSFEFLLGFADSTFIGSNQGDSVFGGNGDDTILGGDGNDTIDAGSGQDEINAGNGDDLIYVGFSADGQVDNIQGGLGLDTVYIGGMDLEGLNLGIGTGVEQLDSNEAWLPDQGFIHATSGNNVFDISGLQAYLKAIEFHLSFGDDSFIGSDLADTVYAGSGKDTVEGGRGDDAIFGDAGDDLLVGGRGNDIIWGGEGNDTIDAGRGDDTIHSTYSPESDVIRGGFGTDTYDFGGYEVADLILDSAASVEILIMNIGHINGTSDANTIDLSGVEMLHSGSDSAPEFNLGSGNDRFIGSAASEIVSGGAQGDRLFGNDGADSMSGDAGSDRLYGGAGDDRLDGAMGRDSLYGGDGSDLLHGAYANDLLNGGKGNDTLDGGLGNDRLVGGRGKDTFVFGNQLDIDFGNDTINDFAAANGETIDLSLVLGSIDFADLVNNHIRDNGGHAEIFFDQGTILLRGIAVSEIGDGLAYSADDFLL